MYMFDVSPTYLYAVCNNFKAQCFVYASPQKENQRAIKKGTWIFKRFIMPLWSEEELLKCRSDVKAYASISEDQVIGLFWAGGGIARTVLRRPRSENLDAFSLAAELEKAVKRLTLEDLQAMFDSVDEEAYFPPNSDQLLHWDVPGGTWRVTTLGDNPTSYNLQLPSNSHVKVFRSIKQAADLAAADMSSYLVPLSRICPAIDSLNSPALLFQMTVASSHDLVLQPLQDMVTALTADNNSFEAALKSLRGNMTRLPDSSMQAGSSTRVNVGKKPWLIFVVPEGVGAQYTSRLQNYTVDGKVLKKRPASEPVVQAVMEIPLLMTCGPEECCTHTKHGCCSQGTSCKRPQPQQPPGSY
eukprot:GHUV01020322.1.p1 GENE.GHUV01020322.1~~GHUV01020322.1.p1  ORF type:complete len:356 (+),score=67.79 GHUV01020322.1:357-1424(+)